MRQDSAGCQARSMSRAARTSSSRRTGRRYGAPLTRSGSFSASRWICFMAATRRPAPPCIRFRSARSTSIPGSAGGSRWSGHGSRDRAGTHTSTVVGASHGAVARWQNQCVPHLIRRPVIASLAATPVIALSLFGTGISSAEPLNCVNGQFWGSDHQHLPDAAAGGKLCAR